MSLKNRVADLQRRRPPTPQGDVETEAIPGLVRLSRVGPSAVATLQGGLSEDAGKAVIAEVWRRFPNLLSVVSLPDNGRPEAV